MRIDLSIRTLHFGMVTVVFYQLISSIWMLVPEPGKMHGFENTLFALHITIFGWGALILGSVYALIRFYEPEAWGRLIPWFSSKYRSAFFESARKELPNIFKGRLAPPEDTGALAGAVHGFGFLLLIALGLTGGYVAIGIRSDGTMRADTLLLLDFHQLFGFLVWAFIVTHVIMTLYHLILNHRKVVDIFKRGRIPWR